MKRLQQSVRRFHDGFAVFVQGFYVQFLRKRGDVCALQLVAGGDDRAAHPFLPSVPKEDLAVLSDQRVRDDVLDPEDVPHGVGQGLAVIAPGARERHLRKRLLWVVVRYGRNLPEQVVSQLDQELDPLPEARFLPEKDLHLFVLVQRRWRSLS